jgi:hypothetical protein
MANEFIARRGLIVSGSTISTGGFTGSLTGTATTASFATSASFASNARDTIRGKVIYVDNTSVNATNTRGTLSKYNSTYPFTTIQAAINSASSGDSIWIYPGTYNEALIIGASGSLVLNMKLESGVIIDGGVSSSISIGSGSSQCYLNLDMMPNTIIRNTGNSANPSGSSVINMFFGSGGNNGCTITGMGNPLARSHHAVPTYYTTANPTIRSVNSYCIWAFGATDNNPDKISGVTLLSENSIPIADSVSPVIVENCVIYALNNYGVFGSSSPTFRNCKIISNKTCIYNSNTIFSDLVNCELYSTTEYGIFANNNIFGRLIINNCRINSFSQSLFVNSNSTQATNYEIVNNVMGSRNLASTSIVSITDTFAGSTGIFSNNVVNKSGVTFPATIGEFNTYISNNVSGSIPFIIV